MSVDLALRDRVVVVTGGSSGIGLATVAMLHEAGALVATCARDGARLAAAVAEAGCAGDRVFHRSCDVRRGGEVQEFVTEAAGYFGRLDGLVNNAGQARMKGLLESTEDDWRDELDLKFSSVLRPTMAALPHLRDSDGAAVVNLNAVLATQPDPRLATTAAARAGVLNLSKSLSLELAEAGVRVNSVCIGIVDSGQWRRRYEASGATVPYEVWQAELAADRGVPLGRLGRPREAAAVVVMLLSPLASYVTGAVVNVDGGLGRHLH